MSIYEQLIQSFEKYWYACINKIPSIIVAIIILIITYIVSKIIESTISKGIQRTRLEKREIALIKRVINFVIIVVGIVVALSALGVNFMALATSLGLIGFAIGFALQDIIKNFLAGILLLAQRPFNLGDIITVGEFTGNVREIKTRYSIIETYDGKRIIIPNADLFSKSITLATGRAKRRYSIEVKISYNANIDKAIRVGLSAISNVNGVLDDPNIGAIVEKFGDGAIVLQFSYWAKPNETDVFELKSEVIKHLKEAFDRESIEIACPMMKIVQERK